MNDLEFIIHVLQGEKTEKGIFSDLFFLYETHMHNYLWYESTFNDY